MSGDRDTLKGMLTEDDASRYLEALPEAQRRPQYVTNALAPSPETFSEEEREAALAIFTPDKRKDQPKSE